ncbi:hypothetical protein [Leptospira stimsonii]|uniref:Uncharacterized protein n=1 Tax=Leptospira stimsonii TaxID=2202203 RepID=A0ABY2NAI4_9LEPT|nr:hypothetical protein [Leptospira stimsonii]TGK23107.1 hypothetical protein EHO98_05695 [Leptospira stimsonii]TGM20191.1 hypothetical protein EHQ90_03925 [Leptospira stimsonii]
MDTLKGTGHFQLVLREKSREEVIKVFPGINHSVEQLQILATSQSGYYVGFPVSSAFRRKIINYVCPGSVPANFAKPIYMRTTHVIGDKFLGWHIVDTETLQRRLVRYLSLEERKLSPWGIWNDTLLRERIAEGWTPELEADLIETSYPN